MNLVVPHLDLIIEMIEKNIFRPLPILKKQAGSNGDVNMEEDEQLIDPAWTHLQPVYEFFLQLIVNESPDVKSLKVIYRNIINMKGFYHTLLHPGIPGTI